MKRTQKLATIFLCASLGGLSGAVTGAGFLIPFFRDAAARHPETTSTLYEKARMIEDIKNGANKEIPGYLVRSDMKTYAVYDESAVAKANGHDLTKIPPQHLWYSVPLPLDSAKFLKEEFAARQEITAQATEFIVLSAAEGAGIGLLAGTACVRARRKTTKRTSNLQAPASGA
jgi:hypothetical protein